MRENCRLTFKTEKRELVDKFQKHLEENFANVWLDKVVEDRYTPNRWVAFFSFSMEAKEDDF